MLSKNQRRLAYILTAVLLFGLGGLLLTLAGQYGLFGSAVTNFLLANLGVIFTFQPVGSLALGLSIGAVVLAVITVALAFGLVYQANRVKSSDYQLLEEKGQKGNTNPSRASTRKGHQGSNNNILGFDPYQSDSSSGESDYDDVNDDKNKEQTKPAKDEKPLEKTPKPVVIAPPTKDKKPLEKTPKTVVIAPPTKDEKPVEKTPKPVVITPPERVETKIEKEETDFRFRKINLAYNKLQGEKLTEFTRHLEKDTALTKLTLSGNTISEENAQTIANSLAEHPSLEELDLSSCKCNSKSFRILGKALATIKTLKKLDLSYNKLGDDPLLIAEIVSQTKLESLNLGSCELKDLSGLSEAISKSSTLHTLELSGNNFSNDEYRALITIVKSKKIKVLDLSRIHGYRYKPAPNSLVIDFLSAGGEELTMHYYSSEYQSFFGEKISATTTATNNRLTKLDLRGSSLSSHDIAQLTELIKRSPSLTTLDLSSLKLTDTNIDIDTAVINLLTALGNHSSVESIELKSIGMTGKTVATINQALKNCPKLKKINIAHNPLTSTDFNQLDRKEQVDYNLSCMSSEDLVASLQARSKGETFQNGYIDATLYEPEAMTHAIETVIGKQGKVTTINLHGIKLNQDQLATVLRKAPRTIKVLKLSDLPIGKNQEENTQLTLNNLSQAITAHTALEEIHIDGCALNDKQLSSIISAATKLKLLSFDAIHEKLELTQTTSALVEHKSIRSVTFKGLSSSKQFAILIKESRTITHLDLRAISFYNRCLNELGDALSVTQIQCISFDLFYADHDFSIMIPSAITENHSIRELKLSHFVANQKSMGALGRALSNSGIESITVTHGKMTHNHIAALSNTLTDKSNLKSIALTDNGITDKGAIALVKRLSTLKSLIHINLSHNKITDKSFNMIQHHIREGWGLVKLELNSCQIEIKETTPVLSAINESRSLKLLSINKNQIESSTALALSNTGVVSTQDQYNSAKVIETYESRSYFDKNKLDLGFCELNLYSLQSIQLVVDKIIDNLDMKSLNLNLEQVTSVEAAEAIALKLKGCRKLKEVTVALPNKLFEKREAIHKVLLVTIASLPVESIQFNQLMVTGDAQLIAQGLMNNSSLNNLHFYNNLMTDKLFEILSPSINSCKAINALTITYNQLTEKSMGSMATFIEKHPKMISLGLSFNRVGSKGVMVIAEALAQCKSLTALKLHTNSIGDEGAKALASVLQANEHIEIVDLGENLITDEGAGPLMSTKPKMAMFLSSNFISTSFIEKHNSRNTDENSRVDLGISRKSDVLQLNQQKSHQHFRPVFSKTKTTLHELFTLANTKHLSINLLAEHGEDHIHHTFPLEEDTTFNDIIKWARQYNSLINKISFTKENEILLKKAILDDDGFVNEEFLDQSVSSCIALSKPVDRENFRLNLVGIFDESLESELRLFK